ncbi:interferon-induced protein 44-like [Chanos chanos]|uniref:Interferon-induced protein 44-like n=1 Tax=Chanos chanos TaxID=29144 RepID=A0A6J2WAB0_CHACN|nr:interferon-induced protein 44-like [Chanos chanos]
MGSDLSVETSLSDKELFVGQDITFKCEVNKCGASAQWKKDGRTLSEDKKYSISWGRGTKGDTFSITIKNVQLNDDGYYSVYVRHKDEKVKSTARLTVKERLKIVKPFGDVTAHGGQRIVLKCGVNRDGATAKWLRNNKQMSESINATMTQSGNEFILTIEQAKSKVKMMKELCSLKLVIDPVRILLHGPIGAGKSSFVNSLDTIFKGRITGRALVDAGTEKSFTKTYKAYRFRLTGEPGVLPFVVNDIMGLEQKQSDGAHTDDIIKALQGHMRDNYKFVPGSPLSEEDPDYISEPSLTDKVHCLVSVISADAISRMDNNVIKKMRAIREKASDMGIPQVVVLTMVDKACQLVASDLSKIYSSVRIKEKIEECHTRVGVPMNCIFPVKNYHDENCLDPEVDCLILAALIQILHLADDYLFDLYYSEGPPPKGRANSP